MEYLFPFEKVKRDSRVIIYGAGKVGQIYLRQIKRTQYCTVVCMADKQYQRYQGIGVQVITPENIQDQCYDVIVIAMAAPNLRQESSELLHNSFKIPYERIITSIGKPIGEFAIRDTQNFISYSELAFSKKEMVSLAIHQGSGFGDLIMLKPYAIEIAAWDPAIRFDLYVHPQRYEFARVLYRDVPAVNAIIPAVGQYAIEKENYHIAMTFKADLDLDWWNKEWMQSKKPYLAKKLEFIDEIKERYGTIYGSGYYVHYARCEKDGLMACTAYNRYGLKRKNYLTTIPMSEDFYTEYKNQKLDDYITVNYGWGSDTGLNHCSGKVWLFSYYEKFVRLVKERLPQLKVVQIGQKTSPCIDGCDAHFMGKNIELVKYVLQGSLLHIDCEGGMTHLATNLKTKCIVLFGMTPIKYYGYPQNINLQAGDCQNCCWMLPDNVSCYRGFEEPPCMAAITPEMVMEKVEGYLDERRK